MGVLQSREEEFRQFLKEKLVIISPPPESPVIKTACRKPVKSTPQNFQTVEVDAKPREGINQNRVIPFDGRTRIFRTDQWPYSVHGLLAMKFNSSECYGTGIMIGANIVLTAGHNLYDYKRKIYADLNSMLFLPGMSSKVLPFGSVEVRKYFVSPNYIREGKEDYGILILKEPIGDETGYFGLACLDAKEIKQKRINVTGYPHDKVNPRSNNHEMWGMESEAVGVDQDRGLINYLINAGKGQSGSGVWYQEGKNFYICGVHVLGTHFVNKATLLTRPMYSQIYSWIQQMGSDDWLLQTDGLNKLEFMGQNITTGCITILKNLRFEDLNFLDLARNNIDAEGAKALAQNISWINLSQLNLARNKIDGEGAKGLAQNTSWFRLSQLDLSDNQIDSEGIKSLAQNTSWISLSELNLSNNRISAEGIKALMQNASWTNLSHLNISWNSIGAEGIKALAQNPTWTKPSQSKIEEFKQLLENGMPESIYPKPDAQEIKSSCRRPKKLVNQNITQKVLNAKPIEGKYENVVNAFDQRKQIHSTNKWPYSVHGVLAVNFSNNKCWGTGVLIGPNIVLTAGHNLYNFKSKTYADLKTMQFIPGMNGQGIPFGAVEVERYFVSPNYTKVEIEDYGVLILKEPIGEKTGYFGLACLEPEEIRDKKINVSGYPADKVASKPNVYELWGMEGTTYYVNQKKSIIEYVIDTGPGQSGSGVWYQEGENYYVCGIHVKGGISVNSATLLTKAIYEKIYTFVQESSFKELLKKMEDSGLNLEGQGINMEQTLTLNKSNLDDPTYSSLFYNSIGALAQDTFLSNLSELNLSGNNIGVEGARALAQNTSWTKLSLLNLSSNNIGVEGAKELAKNTSWVNLTDLDLSQNNVGEEGKKALRQNKTWKEKNFFL